MTTKRIIKRFVFIKSGKAKPVPNHEHFMEVES